MVDADGVSVTNPPNHKKQDCDYVPLKKKKKVAKNLKLNWVFMQLLQNLNNVSHFVRNSEKKWLYLRFLSKVSRTKFFSHNHPTISNRKFFRQWSQLT